VDLYLLGISYGLETLLVKEYANNERPCDSEIYRKIREYQLLLGRIDSNVSPITCVSLEMRWWARFNLNREKRLQGLLRNRRLAAAFDALSKIPGLFDAGMMVTTLHTVMATKCYEVSISPGIAARFTNVPLQRKYYATYSTRERPGPGS
jgi:hypothetical protein